MMPRSVSRYVIPAALAASLLAGAPVLGGEQETVRPFRAVQEVFTQSCALSSCHSAVARKGGLVLDHEDVSYQGLVDREPQHPDARGLYPRVKSGDPLNSFLIRKLRGQGPGDRMPQAGAPLSEDTIQMIEDWIRRGAHATAEECPPANGGEGGGGQAKHGSGHVATICDDEPIGGDYVWKPLPPLPAPPPGEGLQLHVPQRPVDAGTEWEICYAFKPDFSTLQSTVIAHQEYRMQPGSHHLLLYMYFGEHPEEFAEGFYPCLAGQCINPGDCPEDSTELQFTIGGTQVAGTAYQVNYPPGVGLPILNARNAVLIANLHYTNTFQPPQPIYGEAWINLYMHEPDGFKVILDGIFGINFGDLVVEPHQTKTISRLWRPRSFLTRDIVDAAVFQLFGHMHKRGREFRIDFVDAWCTADCDKNDRVEVNELVRSVNVALGSSELRACESADRNVDGVVSIDELVGGVNTALNGCRREADVQIYTTREWDNAPIEEYDFPYLSVGRNQALRWSCTHENGRLLEDGTEDPTYPAKKCHEGCAVCGWNDATRTCTFNRDRSGRVYREGEPMPLAFGLLADDDMCNMFGYFIRQQDVDKIEF